MKKTLLTLAFTSLLFIGCSNNNDDESTNAPGQSNSENVQYFHPPTWIKGTWSSTTSDPIKYKFTDNDFIQINSGSEMSNVAYLKQIKSLGGTVSVDETANENQYYFTMKMNGSNMTYQFKKVTATKLLWVNHPSSGVIDIYLYKQ